MTHPLIAERVSSGEVRRLGLYVTKDGKRIYVFDWETDEYVQITTEEELFQVTGLSAAA